MKYQYFIAFFLLAITTCFAQVTGKIIDVDTNEPLEYATAAIFKQANKELVTGVITDINGVFSIPNLKKGSYYLEVSFLGYETKTINNIVLENNRIKELGTIGLSIGGTELDEVVLKANRATVINKIDRQVYDAKVFQNSQGGSATDVIKNLPSVNVNGLGDISVRGTTGFVALLNGKPVQGNAATMLNQLPANAIERVELITAPSAKYDPEGKGGILNIITKKGATNGTFTQINVKGGFPSIEDYDNGEAAQRYGADVTYNVRSDKWNVSLGASYQRNDVTGRREGDVYTIIEDTFTRFPSDGERSYDETNYSGRFTLDYTPDTKNEFSLGFFGGKRSKDRRADILYYDNHSITPVNGSTRDYTFQYFNENLRIRKGDFVLGSLDYSHTFTNTSKLSSSFLYEYTLLGGPTTNRNLAFPNTEVILQDEFNTNDNPLHGIRAQIDYSFVPLSFGKIETGYQYRNLDHKGDFVYERRNNTTQEFELVPEFSSQVDLTRTIHSGYIQLNGKKSKWDYAAGVRVEAMDRTLDLKDKTQTVDTTYAYKYEKLFPSASLHYSINKDTKVKLAYSKRVERTTSFKLNPFREREHSETLEQGDPTLRPEFIDLVELGITKKYKNGNSVYATAYYRDVKNLVNRVNQIYNDTILDRIYSNVGKAHVTGVELGSQFKATGNWSNFIGGNIYNYTIDGEYDGRSVDSDATVFSVNANSTYTFNDTASLQFTVNYLSKRKTAQGEDSEFYLPNLTFRKTFLDNKLVATLQWQNMDMGLLNTNEQRITTSRDGEFFTTTNYVLEVDRIILNVTYSFNKNKNRSKFIESEFGKREF
ncbi:TonB-dependent receptor [uncultured Maribacter sp.]|uniref:TonB-dependent receptor domain-containing protein n=1 Tax=uncultured Maribacter sp. TaxID=431308 RepID=UPI00262B2BEB|nr:TonB-dependent receptor [uncultured Maribacter sp.]